MPRNQRSQFRGKPDSRNDDGSRHVEIVGTQNHTHGATDKRRGGQTDGRTEGRQDGGRREGRDGTNLFKTNLDLQVSKKIKSIKKLDGEPLLGDDDEDDDEEDEDD